MRQLISMKNRVKSVYLNHKVSFFFFFVFSNKEFHSLFIFYSQGQTTKEASAAIHGLMNTIMEQEHDTIGFRSIRPTTISTSTMPKTPVKMVSTGTMPRTPTVKSTGTMSNTPTVKSTGTMPKTPITTIDLVSSPTIEIIDLVTPTREVIDLCTPTTPTNAGSPHSQPHLSPQ